MHYDIAFQVNVVVENAETLHIGWCLYIRERARACVYLCV
jgi:hypothetical protein